MHISTGRHVFYIGGPIFYRYSSGTKACVTTTDLIDLDGSLHCFMRPLSSCNIKISVASLCRMLTAVWYMKTQLFAFIFPTDYLLSGSEVFTLLKLYSSTHPSTVALIHHRAHRTCALTGKGQCSRVRACSQAHVLALSLSRVHKFARVPVFLRFQRAGGCGVVQAAVAAATAACTNFRCCSPLPPPPSLLHRILDGERRILDRVRRIFGGGGGK